MKRTPILLFLNLILSIAYGQAPANDNCDSAIEIICGEVITGSTINATFRNIPNGCDQENESDVWYSFIGNGQILNFDFLSSTTGSINFDVLIDDCLTANTCFKSIRLHNNTRFDDRSFLTEMNITYLFRIDISCCNPGNFSFSVSCNDIVNNDTCEGATLITCGQTITSSTALATFEYLNTNCGNINDKDVWYKITGNDQVFELIENSGYNFDFKIFESSCNVLTSNCIESDFIRNKITFFGAKDVDYLINIYDVYNNEFSFTINCGDPIPHDSCVNARAITCGERIFESTQFVTNGENNSSSSYLSDLWYTYTGDGKVLQLTYHESDPSYISFDFLNKNCSDDLSQSDYSLSISTYTNTRNFLTEPNTDYLIRLTSQALNSPEYNLEFSIDCIDELQNDRCENATNISCGNRIEGDLSNATYFALYDGCKNQDSNDLWYTFQGTGEVYEFKILEDEMSKLTLDIYSEQCSENYFTCIESLHFDIQNFLYNSSDRHLFSSLPNTQYWIRISSLDNENDAQFSLEVNCLEPEPNDYCDDAIQIECGNNYNANTSRATFSNSYNGCDYERNPDLWYSLAGDGKIYKFNFNQVITNGLRVKVYTGFCNQYINCFLDNYLTPSENSFQLYAEEGEDYLIYISSQNGNDGQFTFDVSCPPPIDGDFCSNPMNLSCGSTINGSIKNATFKTNQGCYTKNRNDLWFTIQGDGNVWGINYINSSDYKLDFELFESDCPSESSSCLDNFTIRNSFDHQTYFFLTKENKTYLLRLISEGNNSFFPGEFQFDILCNPSLANDKCDDAILISCGETVNGTTDGATFNLNGSFCTNSNTADVWYKLIGSDEIIQVSFNSSDRNFILIYLMTDACSESNIQCLGSISVSALEPNSASFYAENGVDYYFRITLDDSGIANVGEFSFNVICSELANNNDCENALSLNCDQVIQGNTQLATPSELNTCFGNGLNDLWYSIDGDDAVHSFEYISSETNSISFSIYNATCEELTIQNRHAFYTLNGNTSFVPRFFADSGQKYFIKVTTGCYEDIGTFSFRHICPEPIEGDNCIDAIPIICSMEYSGSLEFATLSSQISSCNNSSYSSLGDVWYSIEGDDMIYNFTTSISFSRTQIEIFKSNCSSENFECLYSFDLDDYTVKSFLAEAGKSYLVRIQNSSNNRINYNFSVDCYQPASNNSCDSAEVVECGLSINLDFKSATLSGIQNVCNQYPSITPDLWYKYMGSGDFVSLFLEDERTNVSFSVDLYTETCTSFYGECPEYFYLYREIGMVFYAEADRTYWLRITNSYAQEATILFSCHITEANDSCENAELLVCGQIYEGNTNFATAKGEYNGCIDEFTNDVWYTFIGNNEILEFDLLDSHNDVLSFQIYEEECSIEYAECNPFTTINNHNNNDGRYYFFGERDKTYKVRITTGYNEQGYYQFKFNCLMPAINDTCDEAITISCGDYIIGNSQNASTTADLENCFSYRRGNDLWYHLEGDGRIYSFDYNYAEYHDIYIYILTNDCTNISCQDYTTIIVDSYSSDIFLAEDGQEYWIVVTAYENNLGEFSLELLCEDAVQNDNCTSAIEISCAESVSGSTENALPSNSYPDVWYTFVGTGQNVAFEYLLGQNSRIQITAWIKGCVENDFKRNFEIRPNSPYYFPTTQGEIYHLQLSTGYSGGGDFSFDISCQDPFLNDFCQDAIEVSCGESIQGSTEFATFTNEYNGCNRELEQDIWYVIEGTNQLYDFINVGSHSNSINFEIYAEECTSENSNCVASFTLFQTSSYTEFLTNRKYYIRVFTTVQNGGAFEFSINCLEPVENNNCVDAISVECNQTIIGNTLLAGPTTELSSCVTNLENVDVWYEIMGTGELIEFGYLYSDSHEIYLDIFRSGDCDFVEINCVSSLYITSNSRNNIIQSIDGVPFLIRASTGSEQSDKGEFSFNITCHEPLENDSCNSAIPVDCGQIINGTLELATTDNIRCRNSLLYRPGIWYVLEVDGENVYEFNLEGEFDGAIYIYQGECSDDACLESFEENHFFQLPIIWSLRADVYYIFVSSSDYSRNDFSLTINCIDPKPNDVCTGAIELTCDTIITDSLNGATSNREIEYCYNYDFDGPSLWYNFQGNGETVQLLLDSDELFPSLIIFEGQCDDLHCLDIYGSRNSILFETEKDKTYFLNVTDNNIKLNQTFELSINCNYYYPSDPCVCNNDQSGNNTGDGTFDETVTIENTDASQTWTIYSITSAIDSLLPEGIIVGSILNYDPNDQSHKISFSHSSNSGYSIQIIGPDSRSRSDNDTLTISNFCNYPFLDTALFSKPLPIGYVFNAQEIANEVHGYPGIYKMFIDDTEIEELDTRVYGLGDQNIRIEFFAEHQGSVSSDINSPANPGCSTLLEGTITIEELNPIPTLSQWGIICLSLLFLIFGIKIRSTKLVDQVNQINILL